MNIKQKEKGDWYEKQNLRAAEGSSHHYRYCDHGTFFSADESGRSGSNTSDLDTGQLYITVYC